MEQKFTRRAGHKHVLRLVAGLHRADFRTARHRRPIRGQRQRHGEERGDVEGGIAALAAVGQPPLTSAQGRAIGVDGQRRIKQGQADHLLAASKQSIDRRLVGPRWDFEPPGQVNRHTLVGQQRFVEIDAQRCVIVGVDEGGGPAIDEHALDHQVAAVMFQHRIEAKNQVRPRVDAGIGDDNGGAADELQFVGEKRGVDGILRRRAKIIEFLLEFGFERRTVKGVGIGCRRCVRRHASTEQEEHRQQRQADAGREPGKSWLIGAGAAIDHERQR